MKVFAASIFLGASFFWGSDAQGWNIHQNMVNRILEDGGFSSATVLKIRVDLPCQEEEQKEISRLADRIQVRAEAVPVISKKKCGGGKPETLSVSDLLRLGFIDEPDHGMDQDLPESADPSGDRKWMGGVSGPTSQGFRHMVFPGIEWSSPLRTLQIPMGKVGVAPERIDLLSKVSAEYIKADQLFFGLRTLLWREHFIQDLLQPFHTSQVPDPSMLPWKELFSGFVKQSTRTIANYHYAYEGLADEMVKSPDDRGVQDCLQGGSSKTYSDWKSHLALSRAKAYGVGAALYLIFGDYLKSKTVDLPMGLGSVDYYELLNAASVTVEEGDTKDMSETEKRNLKRNEEIVRGLAYLREHTCELMREASALFRGDLDQALGAISAVSKTGK
ncbi:MAG: hypothetical protein KGP28_05755 [Bdellovibrionales bacterium]|nr:hypothetical protein [Bdellovibrionales bacterium]